MMKERWGFPFLLLLFLLFFIVVYFRGIISIIKSTHIVLLPGLAPDQNENSRVGLGPPVRGHAAQRQQRAPLPGRGKVCHTTALVRLDRGEACELCNTARTMQPLVPLTSWSFDHLAVCSQSGCQTPRIYSHRWTVRLPPPLSALSCTGVAGV
jgi:hypothetical protein